MLPINHLWYHAVNDQTKLDDVLKRIHQYQHQPAIEHHPNNSIDTDRSIVHSIEADIIFSANKSTSVMGHPPDTDGELTLSSFLDQIGQAHFQSSNHTNAADGYHVLKLDFKSMAALQYSFDAIKLYLSKLSIHLHQYVWINADILAGPGEDLSDTEAQLKLQPKLDASEFLSLVTQQLPGTSLSIGWVTSLTDIRGPYTHEMVDEMIQLLEHYPSSVKVTFPVRATCFRISWNALQRLYQMNTNWTVTLWWSLNKLPKEDFIWMYATLEQGGVALRNRTYYDVAGFDEYLSAR